MTKRPAKKTYKDEFTKNHEHSVRYRRRIQLEKEKKKEILEYYDPEPIQDLVRRNYLP